jgi:hypothetical protein
MHKCTAYIPDMSCDDFKARASSPAPSPLEQRAVSARPLMPKRKLAKLTPVAKQERWWAEDPADPSITLAEPFVTEATARHWCLRRHSTRYYSKSGSMRPFRPACLTPDGRATEGPRTSRRRRACEKKSPWKPVRSGIATCTDQNRTMNLVLFLHSLFRGA